MNRRRVAFVHNLLIHYRIPLFNLLSKSTEFKFDFYFGAIHPWMPAKALIEEQYQPLFPYVMLKGLRLPEDRFVSPSLLLHLLDRYDAYVSGPLASPDCWFTFLIAKLLRRPFILWDERWTRTRSSLSRLVQPLQLWVAKKSDSIIVPGSRSLRYFLSELGNVKAPKLWIVPNASTLEVPKARRVRDFRKINRIPPDVKVVLYVGRLLALKGVDVLLRCFARLEAEFGDGVYLLVAGEGEDMERLKSLSMALNLRNVGFPGLVNDQAACIAVSDVVVLPSVSSGKISEVWGLIVNEAASLGKPVVVTKTVGCADDVVERFRCGYVVEDGAAYGLYRAIRKILTERKTAMAMSRNGIKATDTRFNFGVMAQCFVRAIRGTLSEH